MPAVLVGQGLFLAAEAIGWPTPDEVIATFDDYD